MGQPVARQGDTIAHGGSVTRVITAGSNNVLTNGLRTARQGDAVFCVLHGTQVITGGSKTVLTNGKRTARKGDACSCGAIIHSGSNNVLAGG